MEVYLVNFATNHSDIGFHNLEALQQQQGNTARQFGIQNIVSWNRSKLLHTDFYAENRELLNSKRGAGYWAWKPYIVVQQLKRVNDGDIVFYLDVDISFVDNPQPLFDCCINNNGFFFVDIHREDRRNRIWTKRDCFHFMGLDTTFYHEGFLSPGGLQIYQKNLSTMEFLEEVLHFTCDSRLVTDAPNVSGKPNLTGFIEHRHDMSILSLLKLKYGISGFRWPTEHGNHLKLPAYRIDGEYLEGGFYSDKPCVNSPYGTILTAFQNDLNLNRKQPNIINRTKRFLRKLLPISRNVK